MRAQALTAQVRQAINLARQRMATEPDQVANQLKLELEGIRQAQDLDPEVRDQLKSQIETALRETARRRVEFEERRQHDQELLAKAAEERMITDELLRKQDKLAGLMERFSALTNEGRYKIAEEQVGGGGLAASGR